MDAVVIESFFDKHAYMQLRRAGEIFPCSEERFAELRSKGLVEEAKQGKKKR